MSKKKADGHCSVLMPRSFPLGGNRTDILKMVYLTLDPMLLWRGLTCGGVAWEGGKNFESNVRKTFS